LWAQKRWKNVFSSRRRLTGYVALVSLRETRLALCDTWRCGLLSTA
jgi:hypothetical protein